MNELSSYFTYFTYCAFMLDCKIVVCKSYKGLYESSSECTIYPTILLFKQYSLMKISPPIKKFSSQILLKTCIIFTSFQEAQNKIFYAPVYLELMSKGLEACAEIKRQKNSGLVVSALPLLILDGNSELHSLRTTK